MIGQFAFPKAQCVRLDDIRSHGHVLTPGRYVGSHAAAEDETPFAERFEALEDQLEAQFTKTAALTATIRVRLTGVGV